MEPCRVQKLTYFAWRQYQSSGRSPQTLRPSLEARQEKQVRPLDTGYIPDLVTADNLGNEEMYRTDDKSDLEFLDTITNGDEFASTPDETGHLDGTNALLELSHIGLIIPRLHLEGDNRL